jgi:hypothetical protein
MLKVYYWSSVRSWDEDFLDRNETLLIPQRTLTEGIISAAPAYGNAKNRIPLLVERQAHH